MLKKLLKMAAKPIECLAAVLWAPNTDLVIETVVVSPPKEKEVRIKVLYSGVCFSDIHLQLGHNKNIEYPIIPGHESVGVVESVGPGVSSVEPGDTVIPIWCSECGECTSCTKKAPKRNICGLSIECELRGCYSDGTNRVTCKGKSVGSMCRIGTFSEYIVAPEVAVAKLIRQFQAEENLTAPSILIQSRIDLEKVALYGCCVPTGYGAATVTAQIRKGSTVAVWGLGAVGLCTVLGARDCEASTIVGIDLNSDKFDMAKKFGCTHCINPKDYVGKTTKEILAQVLGLSDGLDFTFICVGAPAAVDEAIECCCINGGEIILVGLQEEAIKINPMHLFCGKTLKGTFGGVSTSGGFVMLRGLLKNIMAAQNNMKNLHFKESIPKLLESYLAGKFPTDHLITHVMPFEDVNRGFELLKQGKSLRTILKY